MKNIISAIYKEYKVSIIGWSVTTVAISILIGFASVWLSREGTTLSNFLNGSIIAMLIMLMMSIVMIGLTIMVDGEDNKLFKLIKEKTDV